MTTAPHRRAPTSRKAAAAFRGSRLLTLPEAGHVAMMEYPDLVAAAFEDLLRDEQAGHAHELHTGEGKG